MHRVFLAVAIAVLMLPAWAAAFDCCGTPSCQPSCQAACQPTCPTTTCQTCCKCVPQTCCTTSYKTVTRVRAVRTCEQQCYTDRCGCCRTRNVSRVKLVRECVQVPVKTCQTTYRQVCTTQCRTSCPTNNCGNQRKGLLARLCRR